MPYSINYNLSNTINTSLYAISEVLSILQRGGGRKEAKLNHNQLLAWVLTACCKAKLHTD